MTVSIPARIVTVDSVLVAGEAVNSAIESLLGVATRFQQGELLGNLQGEMDEAVSDALAASELVRDTASKYLSIYCRELSEDMAGNVR